SRSNRASSRLAPVPLALRATSTRGGPMSGVGDLARGVARLRCHRLPQRGQVFPLVAIAMTGLIGVTAFVVDVGAWDQNHRSMQATAHAAALAGARDLPYDQTGASALASSHPAKDGGRPPTIHVPTP